MAPGNTRRVLVALNLMAGLPFGIFFEAMPTYMRVVHCSLAQIGLMAMAQLPWSFKILWSPFLDRYGRLDRWLRAAQLSLGGVFLLLLCRDGAEGCVMMLPMMVALAAASAVQDTVSDATFVHLTRDAPTQEAATVGSLRISAYKVSMMASGGGAIVLGAVWGWRLVFALLCAVCVTSAVVLPKSLKTIAAQPPASFAVWARGLLLWLGHPGAWGTFGFILFYKLGLATLSPMTKPYWVDAGVNQALLGTLSATVGLMGTVGGALLAGLIGGKRGLVLPLVMGLVAELSACLIYAAAVHLPYTPALLGICILAEGLAQGIATAALVQLLSSICDKSQAATQFGALTATFGITRAIGGLLGGYVADGYGFTTLFCVLPLCCLWSLLFVGSVRKRLQVALNQMATDQ